MAKDKDYRKLIGNNPKWRRLRRRKLTANPLCEDCLENGRVASATEVHHVKPVEDGLTFAEKESLAYDYHNLRSLCHACHVEAHVRLGRGGKKHARRKAAAQRERFGAKFLGKTSEEDPRGQFFKGGSPISKPRPNLSPHASGFSEPWGRGG